MTDKCGVCGCTIPPYRMPGANICESCAKKARAEKKEIMGNISYLTKEAETKETCRNRLRKGLRRAYENGYNSGYAEGHSDGMGEGRREAYATTPKEMYERGKREQQCRRRDK